MEHLDRIAEGYEGLLGESLKEKSRRRIDWICAQVQGERVLDIGCSQGICEILLARRGHHVTGIDFAQASIAYARELLDKEPFAVKLRVQLLCADFLTEAQLPETYDTVLMTEVLEHLEHPAEMVEKAMQSLEEGGRVIITVPFGINDFPDHKHTFYLADILELLSGRVHVESIEFMEGWIGFSGIKTERAEPFRGIDAALLKREEAAFFALERPLRDQLTGAIEKYKKAEENYQGAKKWVEAKEYKIQQIEEGQKKEIAKLIQEHERKIEALEAAHHRALCTESETYREQLRRAEEESRRQNDELTRQRDELAGQRDELAGQRDELARQVEELNRQTAMLRGQLEKCATEFGQEEQILTGAKQQLLALNGQLQQALRKNKQYEDKLYKVYGTWYGKIALRLYNALKKVKRVLIRN